MNEAISVISIVAAATITLFRKYRYMCPVFSAWL